MICSLIFFPSDLIFWLNWPRTPGLTWLQCNSVSAIHLNECVFVFRTEIHVASAKEIFSDPPPYPKPAKKKYLFKNTALRILRHVSMSEKIGGGPGTQIKRQETQHGCLPSLLGHGDKRFEMVYSEETPTRAAKTE
jgi:hypothetical protein